MAETKPPEAARMVEIKIHFKLSLGSLLGFLGFVMALVTFVLAIT